MLKHTLTKAEVEALPEALQAEYKETTGGKYRLEVAGIEKPNIWEDFEAVQEALRKEKETVKEKKDKNTELAGKLTEAEEKIKVFESNTKGLDKEQVIEFEKLKRDNADLTTKLEESNTNFANLRQETDKKEVSSQISQYLNGKVVASAIPDAIALNADKFSLVNGQVLTNDTNGGNVGLTIDKYFESVLPTKEHWKIPSNGAGAKGGSGQKAQETGDWADDLKFN